MTTTTDAATILRTHELKTDPAVFAAVFASLKTHEIRLNDRGYTVGDRLILRETQHTGQEMSRAAAPLIYTGRTATRTVSHIQTGYGLGEGWCILSFAAERAAVQPAGEAVAVVDEGDEGIFVDIIYGPDGSTLKRGDRLYLGAQQEVKAEQVGEPVDCPKCVGSTVVGEVRGVRCSNCAGRGYLTPAAPEGDSEVPRWTQEMIDHAYAEGATLHAKMVVAPMADEADSEAGEVDPYEAVYCDLRGCEPHGLAACDDFQKWKAAIARLAAPPAPVSAPVEDALTDTARLDWLDRQGVSYGFEGLHEGNRWEIQGAFANLRIAIDFAKHAERSGV